MKIFQDKVALISGGAGGIGESIAAALVQAGARVAIADISLTRAEATAQSLDEGKAVAIELDVTNEAGWLAARDTLEQRLGPCDIFVSNAGVSYTGALDAITPDAWRWVYDVNVMGSLHGVRTFLPGMKARGREGHVTLMCSITALHPFAEQGAYTTSKAALLNFATVLKRELQGTAVGVSAVCPGIVSTDLRHNALGARPEALRDELAPPTQMSTQLGMKPRFIGPAVVQAMRDNAFFVFTHADYAESIASDRDLMLAAMQVSADPDYREPEALTQLLPR